MCTVTRRARNCGKALGAHNRTVEFDQDTGPKIAKVGVKPLDDSDTTWLVVFRWCGWNHADRQVHSSSFIMGASLRPKGAAFRKDEPALVVKTKRKSPEHPPQFQGVFRLAEGSKRLILSTSFDIARLFES